MRVVLSPNPYRDRDLRACLTARRILTSSGVEAAVALPFALDEGSKLEIPEEADLQPSEEVLPRADVLICFGGDGTILHAARDALKWNVPVLGVNLGSIGFMAELEQGELSLLSRLAAGKYAIEKRMMLEARVRRDGREVYKELALNDAVVTKGAVARVLELELTGDRIPISSYTGDGVVIATPTGSTAYSMAAGGPIVEPTAENLIVTPICAHNLYARSMVLNANRTVGIRLPGYRKSAFLSVDGGRTFRLQTGDWVECTRAAQYTRLIRLTGRSFYERINQKLGKA